MDQEVRPWRRLALIFPGQGSQHVGMGARLAQVSRAAADIFKRADAALETRLSKLCFEGPEEELASTANQQPATFVTSIAWLAALQERWERLDRKLQPILFAGHSMGEFTAAVAAGSMTFEEGLLVVRERGRLMEEAGKESPGGMASILGISQEKVLAICEEAKEDNTPGGYVGLATANCEGQNVISGALGPLERAMQLAEEAGARRVVRLPISVGSHSPLMARASDGMEEKLGQLELRDPDRPLVGNVNAEILGTHSEVHAELRDQLLSGVQWQRSVERMREDNVDMFLEMGPGNVLTRLIRRIDYNVNSFALSDEHDGLLSDNFAAIEAAGS
ncbi:MAG: ACP S-malonyltransferase [Dehalococcoidia bacterium]